ncbi:MAG: adenine nucleotide alpha hydrolase [Spirochaetales bacterium]|nr:adenine nucleotide alpha hydrolase [Spirochaetales bacterium]MCF7937920.1 adenine nucleotide alpha hydrolase [Spirochaetales bacterium]
MAPPFSALKEIVEHGPPPWLHRFIKQTGRGINHHRMISADDTVLIGISGGKDSLSLALALSLRKRWLPIDYRLHALLIDWQEHPLPAADLVRLEEFFEIIKVPFEIRRTTMFPGSFRGDFNCYLCSRNRKRILFERARELNTGIIALGHHQDDIIETTLINMIYRGRFSTMMPVQNFFDGKVQIIRPMCEVPGTIPQRVGSRLELPVTQPDCPYRENNLRDRFRPILEELFRLDRHAREHLYQSIWNIDYDYLPVGLQEGKNCNRVYPEQRGEGTE